VRRGSAEPADRAVRRGSAEPADRAARECALHAMTLATRDGSADRADTSTDQHLLKQGVHWRHISTLLGPSSRS